MPYAVDGMTTSVCYLPHMTEESTQYSKISAHVVCLLAIYQMDQIALKIWTVAALCSVQPQNTGISKLLMVSMIDGFLSLWDWLHVDPLCLFRHILRTEYVCLGSYDVICIWVTVEYIFLWVIISDWFNTFVCDEATAAFRYCLAVTSYKLCPGAQQVNATEITH